jgi:hypothetical protein
VRWIQQQDAAGCRMQDAGCSSSNELMQRHIDLEKKIKASAGDCGSYYICGVIWRGYFL